MMRGLFAPVQALYYKVQDFECSLDTTDSNAGCRVKGGLGSGSTVA